MIKVIIVAPSFDSKKNVSGVSSVAQFIISHNDDVEYIHFQQGKSDGEKGVSLKLWRIIITFAKWIVLLIKERKTIIHYNFSLDANGILRDSWFIFAARFLRHPIVAHIHGGLYLSYPNKPRIIQWLLHRIFTLKVPFIVLSRQEKELLTHQYNIKTIIVLENIVDLNAANLYKRDNYEQKPLRILYLGRIETNKGMDETYAAMELLSRQNHHFKLIFAGQEQGNQHYIDRFSQLLGNRFKYEGVVSGQEKVDLLKSCHIFLMPSYYEGLPISLLESMSFGLVPIVTKVGSIGDYVKDGENGVFVPVKSAKEIPDIISMLNSDREKLRLMSNNARETIMESSDANSYIKKLNILYKSLL